MNNDQIVEYKARILRMDNLPALPTTLLEVSRLMESGNVSTDKLAQVISHDQAMAAKVLRMVNSPIYGFSGRISSVKNALTLLGLNVIRGIVISAAVFDSINAGMGGLWEHSLGCSLACAQIARETGRKNPEEFAVAGLLHDIGKAVFSLQIPEARRQVDKIVAKENISFFEAETRVLGFGHVRINKWLCDLWHLPPIISEGMVYHHAPMSARLYPEVAAAVHLGNFCARLYDCGFAGDRCVTIVDTRCLKELGLDQEKLEKLLNSVGKEFGSGRIH